MYKLKQLIRSIVTRILLPLASVMNSLRPGVRILMYHRVSPGEEYDQLTVTPERFDEQVKFLSESYRIISLADAVKELKAGIVKKNTVVLTFDDGYLDNLTYALPVLEKYNAPATIFITTLFCDQIKSHPRYAKESGRLHLTWDEVKILHKHPKITIGSHTLSHPYLSSVDAALSRNEIVDSKAVIEQNIGMTVNYFCYPSGDFGDRELGYIKEAGYEAAVTVAPGKNRPGTSFNALNRTEITQKDNSADIYAKLAGAFDIIHKILHWRRQRKFASAAQHN